MKEGLKAAPPISPPTDIPPAPQPGRGANQTLSLPLPFWEPQRNADSFSWKKCPPRSTWSWAWTGPGQVLHPEVWGPCGRPLTHLSPCLKTHHSVLGTNSLHLSWLPFTGYKTDFIAFSSHHSQDGDLTLGPSQPHSLALIPLND